MHIYVWNVYNVDYIETKFTPNNKHILYKWPGEFFFFLNNKKRYKMFTALQIVLFMMWWFTVVCTMSKLGLFRSLDINTQLNKNDVSYMHNVAALLWL